MKEKEIYIKNKRDEEKEKEREERKKRRKLRRKQILYGRILYVAVFVIIQITAFVLMFLYYGDKMQYFYTICTLISIVAGIHVINKNSNPAYKIAWLIPLLMFPIFGGLLYVMFGIRYDRHLIRGVLEKMQEHYRKYLKGRDAQALIARCNDPSAALQSAYISASSGFLPYTNTDVRYFACGEDLNPTFLELLSSAKRYIFLEYFIIEEGQFWDNVLKILEEKVKEGVDVRVIYDDVGCMLTLPRHYDRELRRRRIQVMVFNRFHRVLTARLNNRDHRKICVVDGTSAITGGINLADEYINAYEKYGYWKDTAILLHGDGAWSFTIQFLSLWNVYSKRKDDFFAFTPVWEEDVFSDVGTASAAASAVPTLCRGGIVQPYTDIPDDNELLGKTVYFNMITRATKYVYIATPYLILDSEMMTALQNAAKSGVDVRIITPHIPDKKTVFFLTRSYYKPLMDAGVKIYEFTPGFIHAKSMVADDRYAVVGSINLDFRSLYLHMECAVWMYETSCIADIKEDFLRTQEQSHRMTNADLGKLSWGKRLWLSVLRTFSPLF